MFCRREPPRMKHWKFGQTPYNMEKQTQRMAEKMRRGPAGFILWDPARQKRAVSNSGFDLHVDLLLL